MHICDDTFTEGLSTQRCIIVILGVHFDPRPRHLRILRVAMPKVGRRCARCEESAARERALRVTLEAERGRWEREREMAVKEARIVRDRATEASSVLLQHVADLEGRLRAYEEDRVELISPAPLRSFDDIVSESRSRFALDDEVATPLCVETSDANAVGASVDEFFSSMPEKFVQSELPTVELPLSETDSADGSTNDAVQVCNSRRRPRRASLDINSEAYVTRRLDNVFEGENDTLAASGTRVEPAANSVNSLRKPNNAGTVVRSTIEAGKLGQASEAGGGRRSRRARKNVSYNYDGLRSGIAVSDPNLVDMVDWDELKRVETVFRATKKRRKRGSTPALGTQKVVHARRRASSGARNT